MKIGMKKVVLVGLAVCLVAAAGCSVKKNWEPIHGTRAGGVVTLAYEHTSAEKPILDEQEGLQLAIIRCQSWGYASAEAFGGVRRRQITTSGMGLWQVEKDYQCIGQGVEVDHKK